METASGTLMHGIFALASLPLMIGLLVWGLAAETSAGGVRLADQSRRDNRDDRRDERRTDLRRVA